jgi:hypothetical protein
VGDPAAEAEVARQSGRVARLDGDWEALTVRRRERATAPELRQRQAMLVVDDLSNGRLQRVFAQVPGRAPSELAIGELGDVGHLPQTDVASFGEDDREQVLRSWLSAAGVLKAAREASPSVNLDQEIGEFQFGQPFSHPFLELFGALGEILALHRTDRQIITDESKLIVGGNATIEAIQHSVQLVGSLRQAFRSGLRQTGQSQRLGTQRGPAVAWDQIGFGICIAAAMVEPHVASA